MILSKTEENYLKAIFKLSEKSDQNVSTNNIASELDTTPASVTDMMRKLADKDLVNYEKYKGVLLSDSGRGIAINLIRKHRLWEVFLLEKLGFAWDQVHDVAEELEHIKSPLLVTQLESFLGFPKYDPHGDPIPDKNGNIDYHEEILLHDLKVGESGVIIGVVEQSSPFLQYLDKIKLAINAVVKIVECNEFDDSRLIQVANNELFASEKVCKNLLVRKS